MSLLAAQIALCCVTITAAFVSLRGLARTLTMDLGFDPKNAVLTTFDLSQAAITPRSLPSNSSGSCKSASCNSRESKPQATPTPPT